MNTSTGTSGTTWSEIPTVAPTAGSRQFAQVVVNTTITGGNGDATSDINSTKLSSGTLPTRDGSLTFDTQAEIYFNGVLMMNGSGNDVFASPAASTDIRLDTGVSLVSGDIVTIVYYNI
jgi:hypothetical protein